MQQTEDAKRNPESKYDGLIYKQNCVNDTVSAQVKRLEGNFDFFRINIFIDFRHATRGTKVERGEG